MEKLFTNGRFPDIDSSIKICLLFQRKMSQNLDCILQPWEVECYVENLQPCDLEEVGTKGWFEFHKKLMLLNQQSILEISTLREESVKEWFVSFQKLCRYLLGRHGIRFMFQLSVLIHEAIQITIWKNKVFPILIELNGEPSNTFMLYSVFYHEGIAVSLLENVLFHSDSAEILDDSVLDLVDYAVNNVTALIFSKEDPEETLQNNDIRCLEELLRKKNELNFDIGIKSVSILRYLAEFSDKLPLCLLSRMLTTNDVPYLLTQLIEKHPWKKINAKGEVMIYNGKWEKVKSNEGDKLCKVEGQVWIGLRELLLNPKSAPYYEMTEFRISALSKLQKYLQECVMDQIAPLIELRRWLSYLTISSSQSSNSKPAVCVEIVSQIRSSIMEKYRKKWKKLAKNQSKYLFTKDNDHIKNMAKVLSEAWNIDKLNFTEPKKCALCKDNASKRCSQCRSVWYCGRECQVKDWTNHKETCAEIIKSKEAFGIKD